MTDHPLPHTVTEADVAYFRQKVKRAKSPEERRKHERQLELMEDALIIYHLHHKREE